MIRKIAAVFVAVTLLLALAGCQLAVEARGTSENTDMLCGMFVTFGSMYSDEDVDDIDVEALLNGGTVTLGGGERKPVYAKAQEDDGVIGYVFEGVEGIPLFDTYYCAEGEENCYWVPGYDHSLLEVMTTAGSQSMKLEGTLYVYMTPDLYDEDGQFVCYCNPVYQNSMGEVYMLPATSGMCIVSTDDNPGDDWEPVNFAAGNLGTYSLSGSTMIKFQDQVEKSWTSEIGITIVGINNVQKYVLKEMNTQDGVISMLEITADNIPEAVTLRDDTAYAILEEYSDGEDGGTRIERSIVDMNLDNFTVRFPEATGFAKCHDISINNKPD